MGLAARASRRASVWRGDARAHEASAPPNHHPTIPCLYARRPPTRSTLRCLPWRPACVRWRLPPSFARTRRMFPPGASARWAQGRLAGMFWEHAGGRESHHVPNLPPTHTVRPRLPLAHHHPHQPSDPAACHRCWRVMWCTRWCPRSCAVTGTPPRPPPWRPSPPPSSACPPAPLPGTGARAAATWRRRRWAGVLGWVVGRAWTAPAGPKPCRSTASDGSPATHTPCASWAPLAGLPSPRNRPALPCPACPPAVAAQLPRRGVVGALGGGLAGQRRLRRRAAAAAEGAGGAGTAHAGCRLGRPHAPSSQQSVNHASRHPPAHTHVLLHPAISHCSVLRPCPRTPAAAAGCGGGPGGLLHRPQPLLLPHAPPEPAGLLRGGVGGGSHG